MGTGSEEPAHPQPSESLSAGGPGHSKPSISLDSRPQDSLSGLDQPDLDNGSESSQPHPSPVRTERPAVQLQTIAEEEEPQSQLNVPDVVPQPSQPGSQPAADTRPGSPGSAAAGQLPDEGPSSEPTGRSQPSPGDAQPLWPCPAELSHHAMRGMHDGHCHLSHDRSKGSMTCCLLKITCCGAVDLLAMLRERQSAPYAGGARQARPLQQSGNSTAAADQQGTAAEKSMPASPSQPQAMEIDHAPGDPSPEAPASSEAAMHTNRCCSPLIFRHPPCTSMGVSPTSVLHHAERTC